MKSSDVDIAEELLSNTLAVTVICFLSTIVVVGCLTKIDDKLTELVCMGMVGG